MTERESLYQAVLAEPEADAPRLVYADWLEEHPRGEADTARAKFIRLEVEAAALPAESEDRSRVQTAADRLFNQFGNAWNADLPAWNEYQDGASTLVYRRGFPEELATVLQTISRRDGRLFDEAPIHALRVGLDGRGWAGFSLSVLGGNLGPDLSRIRALTVGPGLDFGTADDIARFAFATVAEYDSLRNLERLSLAGNGITDDTATLLAGALAAAVFRDSLRELDLADNLIREAGAVTVSVTPEVVRFGRLILTGNPLTDYGRRMLRNHLGDRVVF